MSNLHLRGRVFYSKVWQLSRNGPRPEAPEEKPERRDRKMLPQFSWDHHVHRVHSQAGHLGLHWELRAAPSCPCSACAEDVHQEGVRSQFPSPALPVRRVPGQEDDILHFQKLLVVAFVQNCQPHPWGPGAGGWGRPLCCRSLEGKSLRV